MSEKFCQYLFCWIRPEDGNCYQSQDDVLFMELASVFLYILCWFYGTEVVASEWENFEFCHISDFELVCVLLFLSPKHTFWVLFAIPLHMLICEMIPRSTSKKCSGEKIAKKKKKKNSFIWSHVLWHPPDLELWFWWCWKRRSFVWSSFIFPAKI